jgi:hypothetical protein
MRYPVPVSDCTADVEIEPAGFLTRPQLFVNGVPAREGLKKGEFLLPAADGVELNARFGYVPLDPFPVLRIGAESFRAAPPFTWQWFLIWLCISSQLSLWTGSSQERLIRTCLGVPLGFLQAWILALVLRSERPPKRQMLLSFLILLGGNLVIMIGTGVLAAEWVHRGR